MPTDSAIDKLMQEATGVPATSAVKQTLSLLPYSSAQQIVKDSQSQIKSDAIKSAQDSIAELTKGMNQSTASYMTNAIGAKNAIDESSGLKEAQQSADAMTQYAQQLSSLGPVVNTLGKGMLQNASPTFLGATRDSVESYFKELVPDPILRTQAVNNYLTASKRSVTASLDALNSLYQTSVLAASVAAENEQKKLSRIADQASALWQEVSWSTRSQFTEQQQIAAEQRQEATWLNQANYTNQINQQNQATDFANQKEMADYNANIQTKENLNTTATQIAADNLAKKQYSIDGNIIEVANGIAKVIYKAPDSTSVKAEVVGSDATGRFIISYDKSGKQLSKTQITGAVNTTPGVTDSKEFTAVKQIIAKHPGEWGNAADEIDSTFGKGTATKYDDYLKSIYSDNSKRFTASTIPPVTLSELQDDISKGASLSQLYEAYGEISPSLIQSVYYNQ